jgi:hypothetical protein
VSDTIEFLIENNFCVTDNICAFCIVLMDGWDRFCPRCRDYKGVMALPDFVNTYGKEALNK